eukprot:SAG11_NODE_11704_length_743_cov_1.007764_1_plen_124_part_10
MISPLSSPIVRTGKTSAGGQSNRFKSVSRSLDEKTLAVGALNSMLKKTDAHKKKEEKHHHQVGIMKAAGKMRQMEVDINAGWGGQFAHPGRVGSPAWFRTPPTPGTPLHEDAPIVAMLECLKLD